MGSDAGSMADQFRNSFEAGLEQRLGRASRVRLQSVIPTHWFSTAGSECARMYVAGFFYGAISVSQAYVEAVAKFLAEKHGLLQSKTEAIWNALCDRELVSVECRDAALLVLSERNDFHHLNKTVPQRHSKLEARAEDCINQLHAIDTDVFAYSITNGEVAVKNPDYWPAKMASCSFTCAI